MTDLYAEISISVDYHDFELKLHQQFRAIDVVGDGRFGVGLPGIQNLAKEIFVQHEAILHFFLLSTTRIRL